MRQLLSGSSWNRKLLSTKITAEEAAAILKEFEKKLTNQVKKVS